MHTIYILWSGERHFIKAFATRESAQKRAENIINKNYKSEQFDIEDFGDLLVYKSSKVRLEISEEEVDGTP